MIEKTPKTNPDSRKDPNKPYRKEEMPEHDRYRPEEGQATPEQDGEIPGHNPTSPGPDKDMHSGVPGKEPSMPRREKEMRGIQGETVTPEQGLPGQERNLPGTDKKRNVEQGEEYSRDDKDNLPEGDRLVEDRDKQHINNIREDNGYKEK